MTYFPTYTGLRGTASLERRGLMSCHTSRAEKVKASSMYHVHLFVSIESRYVALDKPETLILIYYQRNFVVFHACLVQLA